MGKKIMSKYDKEYCGKSIWVMYKYIALCIMTIILSFTSVHYFCAKGGAFFRIMNGVAGLAIGTSCLFIWGAVIEIAKCRNVLKELKKDTKYANEKVLDTEEKQRQEKGDICQRDD